ncbi:MAG TPA: hypothetical protein VI357_21020 [Mycobacteriales bacterium]
MLLLSKLDALLPTVAPPDAAGRAGAQPRLTDPAARGTLER